ncbi:DUF4253 domain-containing protein [Nocardia sp. NPDC004711]
MFSPNPAITTLDEHDPAVQLIEWAGGYPLVLLPAGQSQHSPDEVADRVAADTEATLILVPAADGAEALASAGWDGPVNHDNDTAKLAAVVRDWRRRFGVTVFAVEQGTLHLAVASPPATAEYARLVANEHFAFCAELVGNHLDEYADRLINAEQWTFWWD